MNKFEGNSYALNYLNVNVNRPLMERSVLRCGDYACQHFLLLLIQIWMSKIDEKSLQTFIREAFPTARAGTKEILLDTDEMDFEKVTEHKL